MKRRADIPRRQRGFGLVELMVSLTLGLLVVGGAIVLLLSTRQANGSSDNLSRVAESVRTSHDLISREIREAGGMPCDAQGLVANLLTNAQGSTPTWWGLWSDPVHGYDGSTAIDGAAFGSGTGQRVSGTAAIEVRYAPALDNVTVTNHDTANQVFTTSVNNHGIAAGDLLVVCNYRQAAIFQAITANIANGTFGHAATGTTPGNCGAGLGLPAQCAPTVNTYQFAAGAMVGRFIAAAWYIGNNGRSDGGGRSLFRVTRLGAEEVADGVRDLQLSYLADGASDYAAASAISDWSHVTAVRLNLTFEGPDAMVATTAGAASSASRRLTRNVSYTLNLRNLQP